ncbi:MAG: 30S ribosomal protein S4 [Candidatus Aenigmarchaeota archaeon]|nr:30S ribosomal protein S4 [Candidatus Aenigmarchaeota archaeon]
MRKIRKKFKNPRMSWDSDNISERKGIMRNYGLRRRREILIAQEILRNFRRRARDLIAEKDEVKTKALLDKLVKLGLLGKDKGLDDVLALTISNILDRRLQTVVWKKGLAATPKQARQFITHCHVTVSGKVVRSPAYIVPAQEEPGIALQQVSAEKGGG